MSERYREGNAMAEDIVGCELTDFWVSEDGRAFRLGVRDQNGSVRAVVLPSDALKSLMMSLFKIADTAMKRLYRDDGIRLVYPIEDYALESACGSERLILTLRTADGFEASFAVQPDDFLSMAISVSDHLGRGGARAPTLN